MNRAWLALTTLAAISAAAACSPTDDLPVVRPNDNRVAAGAHRIDVDAAFEFYRERFRDAGDFTFVLVGNFDPEEIRPLLLTYLGGLPAGDRRQIPDVDGDPHARRSGPQPRRVRRVDNEQFEWQGRPRILFAFNLPAHDAEALVPAHTLALRKAIDPWVGRHRYDRDDSHTPPKWVGNYLTVMERASARSIADELGKGVYGEVGSAEEAIDAIEDDPWDAVIPERYRVGQVVPGKITKLTNFGVFVELQPGLEGLLHISEFDWRRIEKIENELKVGQELEVKLIDIDPKNGNLKLSRKALIPRPPKQEKHLHHRQGERKP